MSGGAARLDPGPALLAASGAVALGAELVWLRQLARVLGATADATALLLAVFMGGLALGALLGERVADGAARPLRLYALAEGVVALSLVLSPSLATWLVEARDLGWLGGANVAGGIVGLLASVHLLLPALGLRGTSLVLAALGAATATAALALGREPRPGRAARHSAKDSGPAAPAPAPALAWCLLAGIGALSFALQVAWNRAFAPLFGSALVGFALVAAAILAGLALGGLRSAHDEAARTRPWDRAASHLLAWSICAFVGTLALRVAPFVLEQAARGRLPVPFTRAALALGVAGLPSFFVGALVPVLAPAASDAPTPGRTAGRALLASTLGNVAGALAAGHLLVPALGPRVVLVGSAAAAAVLALGAAARAGRARVLGTVGALALALPIAGWLDRPWDAVDHAAGPFQVAVYREQARRREAAPASASPERCGPEARFARPRALFHSDGALASVTLLGYRPRDARVGPCTLYSLRANGRAEGSLLVTLPPASAAALRAGRVQRRWLSRAVPAGDLPTQMLGGALGVLGAERPRRTLVVGWGTGLSARALLAGGPARVDAFEIEPAVIEAARLLEPGALRDRRVHLRVDDGRIALAAVPDGALDVLASHPSNPWVAAATSLFSAEYLQLARRKVRPGGRVVAWVQLYAVDQGIVRSLLATFRSVFPDVHVLRPAPHARDLLVLGLVTRRPTPPATVRAWLDPARASAPLVAVLAAAGLDRDALAAAYLAGPDEVERFTRGAPIETDDDLRVELGAATHLVAGTGADPEAIVRALSRAP